MNGKWFLFCALLPSPLWSQGFAGLGGDPQDFALPDPAYMLNWPLDHGPHPEFRLEWWYVTANLVDEAGRDYGVQWTLFRTSLGETGAADTWGSSQVWFGHAAMTSDTRHVYTERFARGGIGQAGASRERLDAWIDDWQLSETTLTARTSDWAFDLDVDEFGPLILHGEDGYSVKSPNGQASHYYSAPRMSVSGTLDFGDEQIAVSGNAWMDREWSSQPLDEEQSGWDWFSLSFESGAQMMGFRLRSEDSEFTSATWIAPEGDTTAYGDGALVVTPLEEYAAMRGDVPVRWRVQLPDRGVDVSVEAINPDAEMPLSVPYWEGPVTIDGSHSGRGYLEMTGYTN